MRGIYLLTKGKTSASIIVIAESEIEAIQYAEARYRLFHFKCQLIGAPLATQPNGIIPTSFNSAG